MLFTELAFLPFFAICFALRWTLRPALARKAWLLGCSYFFYGFWDWRFLGLIFLSTAVGYLSGLALEKEERIRARKLYLTVSLASILAVLGFFKYYNFFVISGSSLLGWLGITVAPRTLEIVLPVGISFFTFQTLSYTFDVYRRRLQPIHSFLDFAVYVSFFPQLVAGPIVRAATFLPQLRLQQRFAEVDVRRFLLLILAGYFKKACLADSIAIGIDPVFAAPAKYGSLDLAIASAGYSAQIYCDFSGYTDMAIGFAGLLGYELCKNFDFPYFSRNVREFWRRWHISLSTWLRDYLYISLGGGRAGRLTVHRNVIITMLLGGLWHGAAMTFVLWGFLHGLALIVHREWSERTRNHTLSLPAGEALGVILTFAWIAICFTIFRSSDITAAWEFLSRMATGQEGVRTLHSGWGALLLLLAGWHWFNYRYRTALVRSARAVPRPIFALSFGACAAVALFFTPMNPMPFIYFQF